jgi:hypothetical protein
MTTLNIEKFRYGLYGLSTLMVLWFVFEFSKIHFIKWTEGSFDLLTFSLISALLIFLLGSFFKNNFAQTIILFPILIVFYISGFIPAASVLFLFFSSKVLGHFLFNLLGIKKQDPHHSLMHMIFGLGLYATLISWIIYFPINTPPLYFILLILPIFLFFKNLEPTKNFIQRSLSQINSYLIEQKIASFFIYWLLILYLIVSLMPDFGADSLAQHLYIPSYVKSHLQWPFDATKYIWASWPLNADFIYTFLYLTGNSEQTIRFGIFCFLLILVFMLIATISKMISRKIALLGAAIFLSMSITFLEVSTAFVEIFWALYVIALFISLYYFESKNNRGYIYIFSIFSGIAIATKMVSFAFVLAPLLIAASLIYKKYPKEFLRISLFCFSLILLFGAEPYLISFIKTGNPILPLFNNIFKSNLFADSSFLKITPYQYHLNLFSLRDMTFNSGKFIEGTGGAIGFFYFIFFPIATYIILFKNIKYSKFLFFSCLTTVFIVFELQSYLRYIYPLFLLIIFLILSSLNSLKFQSASFYSNTIKFSWVLVAMGVYFLPVCTQTYKVFSPDILFSLEKRQEFIWSFNPIRAAIDDVNKTYGHSDRVGFFCSPLGAGLNATAYYANWYNNNFISSIFSAQSSADVARIFEENKIDVIIFDENFNPGGGFPILASIIKDATLFEKDYGRGISTRTFSKDRKLSNDMN